MNKKTISIGIPCFNEELNVEKAFTSLKKITDKINKYNFEYIFTDNGSTDNTRNLITKIVKHNFNVSGVFLSRNFGPTASGQACLDNAGGDAFIFYECDMQDPPELIQNFIKKWEEGYEIVYGVRTKIEDFFIIFILRKAFYRIFRAISNIDVPVDAGGYSLISKRAIEALKLLPEKYRFDRGLRAWVGFKSIGLTYQRKKRIRGKSSYNLFEYIKFSERGIFGFSYLPLDMIIYSGFILVGFSFIAIIVYLLLCFLYGNPIKGSITVLVSIIFFGGIQLLAISILGKYIQVIVEEVKSRPLYIIDKIIKKKILNFHDR